MTEITRELLEQARKESYEAGWAKCVKQRDGTRVWIGHFTDALKYLVQGGSEDVCACSWTVEGFFQFREIGHPNDLVAVLEYDWSIGTPAIFWDDDKNRHFPGVFAGVDKDGYPQEAFSVPSEATSLKDCSKTVWKHAKKLEAQSNE